MATYPDDLAGLLNSFKDAGARVTLKVPSVEDNSLENVAIEAVKPDYVVVRSAVYEGMIFVPLTSVASIRKI
jgi:hypothetical protein